MTVSDRPNSFPSLFDRVRRWVSPGSRALRARRGAWPSDVTLPALNTRRGAPARLATWLRNRDRMTRVIGMMIILCLIIVWIGLGVVLRAAYHEQWEDASTYADNVAGLLVADLETNFTICDLPLQALLSELSNPALMSLPPVLRHQALFNKSFDLPIFGSLVVTDKDGIIREHAHAPLMHRIDVADRDYFKVQRDHRDVGIFVDHPFISRITGEWMVVVSHRIDKDGQFDGVVAGGLRLEFLKRLFLKVHLPPGSTLVLRYEDGTVLMSDASGATSWDPALVKRFAASEEASVVDGYSDGVRRLVRERKIAGLPLYQSVNLPVAIMMKPFWNRVLMSTGAVLATSLVIFALGVTLLRELSRRNAAEVQLQRLATVDGMTGLRNRRCFDEMLAAEIRRGARNGTPLALLMIDVDDFKAYNDNYGHSAGDAALRVVADILSGEPLRSSDIVARVGGEEFAVLACDTDLAGAARLADRILHAIRERRVPHIVSRRGVITVSIGLACLRHGPAVDLGTADGISGDLTANGSSSDGSTLEGLAKSLFDEADAALYRAKRGGRDRVDVSSSRVGQTGFGDDERLIA